MTPTVDGERLLRRIGELAAVGAAPGGGVTRLAWSEADRQAVTMVAGWASEAGAATRLDATGTLLAEVPGTQPQLCPLAMGSHLDTVVGAGALDGAYGVLAAMEVMAALADAGRPLRHPLRVAAFANEEGVVAPPFTGSRAAAGADLRGELRAAGPDGVALADRLRSAGIDPAGLAGAGWGPVAGYLEVHIEQGPVLHATHRRLGVVTAVTGQRRARVEVTGRANHAGTTPMAMRSDALVAAAHAVLAVEDLAVRGPATVATVGRLDVSPDVPNVVPAGVHFTVDVRSVDDGAAAEAMTVLRGRLEGIAARTATRIELFPTITSPSAPTDDRWRALLRAAAERRGHDAPDLASGAGHDAQHIASLGPIGMLFVPSIDGVSHHRDEQTDGDDLVLGAQVALDALVAADGVFDA